MITGKISNLFLPFIKRNGHGCRNIYQILFFHSQISGLCRLVGIGVADKVFVSVQEGDYGVVRGAQKLDLSVEEFEKEMSAAGYKIPVEA